MAKFKNISNQDLQIPGVGIVEAGQTVDMPEGFHNANFEKVEKKSVEKEQTVESNKEIKNTKNK